MRHHPPRFNGGCGPVAIAFPCVLRVSVVSKPPAILLMGPTASGKSALAMEVAARIPVEIVSVDSAQVYRGMNVGTAKPSAAERAAVPHHLVDIIEPTESYSAARCFTSVH